MPGDGGEVAQPLRVLQIRLRVDSPQERHVQRIEQSRHRFVGFDHEHLDERVREARVLGHRIDDLAFFIEHELDFGQIERELPGTAAALLDSACQLVHVLQQPQDFRRIAAARPYAFGMTNLLFAIDQVLRFACSAGACGS